MSQSITLRGMTWNHARGLAPLVATASQYHLDNPQVRIEWSVRSLRDFEEYPIERIVQDFDLVVLDHPCIPAIAGRGIVVALDAHLSSEYLSDQAANSVGASHRSYQHDGHQWALAIDAATPVAFWREDLMAAHRVEVPQSWPELVALASRGHVEVPAAPINCLMNFFTLAVAAGGTPFVSPDQLVQRSAGRESLARLRELLCLCDPGAWQRNPIASHELVASSDNHTLCYCPLAYGYSNYARQGFSPHVLRFGTPPTLESRPLATVLGGTGLAVSARRPNQETAIDYARFTASAEIQRTLYTSSGGQPGHRLAWTDPENNRTTGDYFLRTLPVLDHAWLRPRHAGYQHFQDTASPIVHAALRGDIEDATALDQMDALHRQTFSLPAHAP
ncbi:MAG: extracellular solute-binding protein [Opitutaceae bacterium]|nr:extracellular solute-binding protein [Opitutaceae bacterium]